MLLQALRLKKETYPKEGEGMGGRCQSYQSRARMCESLGKQGDAGYLKDWSEVFFFLVGRVRH